MPDSSAPNWEVRPLRRSDDRAAFDCGHALLNDWLRRRASQYESKGLARTYVAVRQGETRVVGYYAISNHHVSFDALPGEQAHGLPRIDVPVALLGRLAVDRAVQGQGLGAFMLVDALRRIESVAEQIGIRAVEVDAIDEAAKQFYLKYGFVPLADEPRHLFLPIDVVRKLNLSGRK